MAVVVASCRSASEVGAPTTPLAPRIVEARVPPPPPAASRVAPVAERAPPASAFTPVVGFPGAFVVSGLPRAAQVTILGERLPLEPEGVPMVGACALSTEGEVWCFRYRDEPEPDGWPEMPTAPTRFGDVGHADAISGLNALVDGTVHLLSGGVETKGVGATALADDGAACAIRRDGHVACWYAVAPWDDASSGDEVPLVHDATRVAVGRFGGCAVERSGRLACWGAASLIGWAPGGPGFRVPPPTRAAVLRGIEDVVDVSLGPAFPCLVRRSGHVVCWFPEDATSLFPQNPLPPEGRVVDVDDAVSVSGDLLLERSGHVRALRFDFDDAGGTRVSTQPFGEAALVDVASLDGSRSSGCAVRRGGEVVCWGTGLPSP